MNYRAYGLALSSALPLPELEPIAHTAADVTVTVCDGPVREDGWSWVRPRPAIDRAPWLAVAKRRGEQRLLFDGGADFLVRDDAPLVTIHLGASASVSAIRHRLLDQVLPFVLGHHLGRFVLHASAFATPDGAVGLIGPAGAGKSTLAASFGVHGSRLIADDALLLERMGRMLVATPGYPGIRLHPDVFAALHEDRELAAVPEAREKERRGAKDGLTFAEGPVRLSRLYWLEGGDGWEIEITRLSPRDTIMTLIGHTFVLDIADRQRLGDQFARVCEASAAADVRRLVYPRRLSALPQVRAAILADLGGR